MARLFLALFGWQLHLETGREADEPEDADDEPEEPDMRGSIVSHPFGFTQRDPTPYDADFPDRY